MQLQGKSLWLFPVEDKFRQAAHSVVTSSKFETLMLMCILVSCIQMSIEVQDISKESDLGVVLRFTDIITTSIFTLECALKTVELGFVVGKSTYLRSMWNQLDFFIVITSLMSFGLEAMTSGGQSGILDAVRVLRAVRPLRVIRCRPLLAALGGGGGGGNEPSTSECNGRPAGRMPVGRIPRS